jgi:hypothetical protein
MNRKLQKSIHPDKNKHVATEAKQVFQNKGDILTSLYSYYIYNTDCPVPDSELSNVIQSIQSQYIRLRKEFDNQPIDVILRSPHSKWVDILHKCKVV